MSCFSKCAMQRFEGIKKENTLWAMKRRFVLYLLILSVLAQTGGSVLLVLQYRSNKKYITREFCINKQKPELACEGSCHLQKQLGQLEDQPNEKQQRYKVSAESCWVCPQIPRLQFSAIAAAQSALLFPGSDLLYTSICCDGPDHPPQFIGC